MNTEHENHQPGHLKQITVVVNGREKKIDDNDLTFVEVVKLAFSDAVFNENTVYTVTYKRGHGDRPAGSMVEGDTVKVKEGMIFNVIRTDKS